MNTPHPNSCAVLSAVHASAVPFVKEIKKKKKTNLFSHSLKLLKGKLGTHGVKQSKAAPSLHCGLISFLSL
jgi:hypothetical protein